MEEADVTSLTEEHPGLAIAHVQTFQGKFPGADAFDSVTEKDLRAAGRLKWSVTLRQLPAWGDQRWTLAWPALSQSGCTNRWPPRRWGTWTPTGTGLRACCRITCCRPVGCITDAVTLAGRAIVAYGE